MVYTAWSVVFGEQPSAAKWNLLGANDASFNDGTGIANGAITDDKLSTGAARSEVTAAETTTSATYTALSTAQAVTVTIGAGGMALLGFDCYARETGGGVVYAGCAISGANTSSLGSVLSTTNECAAINSAYASLGFTRLLTGLSTGSTTFTMNFARSSGTGGFQRRKLYVIPLG